LPASAGVCAIEIPHASSAPSSSALRPRRNAVPGSACGMPGRNVRSVGRWDRLMRGSSVRSARRSAPVRQSLTADR
jgi:hypothetical protein